MANKTNKLTINKIKQESSKLNKMKAVQITAKTGTTYDLTISQYITNSQIEQAYKDTTALFGFMIDLELNDGEKALTAVSQPYMLLALVGALTDLTLPETIPDRIAVAKYFHDLELFDSIFEKFDKAEIDSATDKLEVMLKDYTQGINDLQIKLDEQMKELDRQEQVQWEVDQRIAQINEIEYKDEEESNVVNLADHKKE